MTLGGDTAMRWMLHGAATLLVVLVATFCVMVQVAHVDDAISEITHRTETGSVH